MTFNEIIRDYFAFGAGNIVQIRPSPTNDAFVPAYPPDDDSTQRAAERNSTNDEESDKKRPEDVVSEVDSEERSHNALTTKTKTKMMNLSFFVEKIA